jgi:hypothetical protein
MRHFDLQKWYLDAVDEDGHACIGYSARLRWKSINITYNHFTFLTRRARIQTRSSFSAKAFPVHTHGSVVWNFKTLSGEWKKVGDAFGQTLLRDGEDRIEWSCLHPKSMVNISIGGVELKNCLGYVEEIRLSIPPWQIPIEKLHWGRYLSSMHTIVWIRWEGPVPRNIVYYNGQNLNPRLIDVDSVLFDEYLLSFSNKEIIRKGSLLSTVFARFPAIAKLFPSWISAVQENKWVSTGTLQKNGELLSTGNVIHEYVIWK